MIPTIPARAIGLSTSLPCAAVIDNTIDGHAVLCRIPAHVALASRVVENGEEQGDWRLTPLCLAHTKVASQRLRQLAEVGNAAPSESEEA